ARGEEPPPDQRNTESAEVTGGCRIVHRPVVTTILSSFNRETTVAPVMSQKQTSGDTCRNNAPRRLNLLENPQTLGKNLTPGLVAIRRRKHRLDVDATFSLESEIHTQNVDETPAQQCRRDKENDSHSNLRDDQPAPNSFSGSTG